MIKWTPIDKDHLPEGEVLAACFDKEGLNYYRKKLIGKLELTYDNKVCIENQYPTHIDYLSYITHYVLIDEYDIEE